MEEKKRYLLNWEDLDAEIIYNNNERMEFEKRINNTIVRIMLVVICFLVVLTWYVSLR